ncbi:MAG: hypothetical protein IKN96_01115 [Oscillibacter sp.]|nr:hypothetical protein [Oscillibacter sp.]
MRKTAIFRFSAFAALLCLWLCGAALATETPVLDGFLRDHQDGVSVTCWYEKEADPESVESALCALYDGNGMLLAVADVKPQNSAPTTVVVPCDTALVDHAKLLAMDADHKPLGASQTLKPSASNTDVPQFMNGYPVINKNGVSVSGTAMAEIKVMADRACRLYWALYKRDAGYATRSGFQSGKLPGSEKHSMLALGVNQSGVVTLNGLEDQTAYDLDMWLTNSDFTASSNITRLSFTTLDTAPPVFVTAPTPVSSNERAVTLQYNLNENASIYWILLEQGSRFPNPPTGGGAITRDYAIKQVVGGNGGLDYGRVNAKANANGTFQISGLVAQKAYDVWYVAKDASGNYSEFRTGAPDSQPASNDPRGVCMTTISTLDKKPPTVEQETTHYPDGHPETPYADTAVRLIFSEGIRRFSTGETLTDLYDAVKSASNVDARDAAKEKLAAFLRNTVILQTGTNSTFGAAPERADDESESPWEVDYRNATVAWEDGKLVLTFPSAENGDSALRLLGGQSYRFHITDISDLSDNLNRITSLTTDAFTTMPAQILFDEITLNSSNYPLGVGEVDLVFSATPVAVSRAGSGAAWDLLFWTDATSAFEVYRRSRPSASAVYDQGWKKVQNPQGTGGGEGNTFVPATAAAGTMAGQSMHLHLCQHNSGSIPALNSMEDGRVYEYAVRFLQIDGDANRNLWEKDTLFEVSAVAGAPSALTNLAASLTKERLETFKQSGSVQEIGSPSPFRMTRIFRATSAPAFANGAPTFEPGDTSVTMWFQMTRPGTVHYLLAPAGGTVKAQDKNGVAVDWNRYQEIPESGESVLAPFAVMSPSWTNIVEQRFSGAGVRTGSLEVGIKGASCTITGLKSETHYFAYFVLQGTGQNYSTSAQLFRFTTPEAAPPSVRITLNNPVATLTVNQEAVTDYLVVDTDEKMLDRLINDVFWNNAPSGGKQPISSYVQVDNVLQAMRTDTGNGSVFDVYAAKEYKEKVAAYIRQSLADGGAVVGLGKGVRVSPSSPLTIDCSLLPMTEGHRYAVLTVTQSVDGGAGVFRAATPITPPDSIPPLVTDIAQQLTMDGSNSIELHTCSGTATLTFDSDLYYFNSGTLKKLDLGPHYSALRDDGFKPLVDIASSSPAEQITVSSGQVAQVNRATSQINLTFKNAASGATIAFPTQMCDEYGNMHKVALTVTLKVNTTQTYDSAGRPVYNHTPVLEVSKSWDGRAAQ